jgi:regulatory protein
VPLPPLPTEGSLRLGFGSLSVKGRALRYLAQREHSRLELERKLARMWPTCPKHGAGADCAALDELTARACLSEQRVADSVLLSQGQRFGSRRLKQTLQAKGLPLTWWRDTLQQAAAPSLSAPARSGSAASASRRRRAERARQMRFWPGAALRRGCDPACRTVQGADDERLLIRRRADPAPRTPQAMTLPPAAPQASSNTAASLMCRCFRVAMACGKWTPRWWTARPAH